jgi:hypothetical protein
MKHSQTLSQIFLCGFLIQVFNGPSTVLIHNLWPADRTIQGPVTTAECDFGITENLRAGLWEHSVGFSHQGGPSAADEFFVVLSGQGRAYLSDGTGTVWESCVHSFDPVV